MATNETQYLMLAIPVGLPAASHKDDSNVVAIEGDDFETDGIREGELLSNINDVIGNPGEVTGLWVWAGSLVNTGEGEDADQEWEGTWRRASTSEALAFATGISPFMNARKPEMPPVIGAKKEDWSFK